MKKRGIPRIRKKPGLAMVMKQGIPMWETPGYPDTMTIRKDVRRIRLWFLRGCH